MADRRDRITEEDPRLRYTEEQELWLEDVAGDIKKLEEQALSRRPHEVLDHNTEFQVTRNKLKVVHQRLELIKQADDMGWVDARHDYEGARKELEIAIKLARRHLT